MKTVLDPMEALHRGVWSRLDAALDVPVLDFVPENTPYPYLTIGETTQVRTDTQDRYSSEMLMTMHIWTMAEGWSQSRGILAQLRAALDNQPETVSLGSQFRMVYIRLDRQWSMRDPDPRIRHIPVRFRVLVEETTTNE